ncbi:GxxExxY protein [Qipengyuania sp. MTN3-11]|uniref:GxxExxY protein n=1 Tax=Qipengyuania sp. MTN3-11 TaxID=3056557 RepID=UPI0036F31107
MSREVRIEALARTIIDCGFHLHRKLGPGLLETAYELILFKILSQQGLAVRRQVPITINYEGVVVDNAFKIDLLVEDLLVVELKSTERASPVHAKQVLTYLRLMNLPLGLLMNFGQSTFKDGIKRVANDYRGPFHGR